MKGLLLLTMAISVIFAFMNGLHDGCNVFATAVSSRSISPKKALLVACLGEFLLPVFSGTAVALTIGKGILGNNHLLAGGEFYTYLTIFSALTGAIGWNVLTWRMGLPSSSSHALIGGIAGAGAAAFGIGSIRWDILFFKIILILLLSPFLAFCAGYVFLRASRILLRGFNWKINNSIKRMHLLSVFFLAGSHGVADAQKTMGILAILLFVESHVPVLSVPVWVRLCSSGALALGVLFGGWKIADTIGSKIYKLEPVHSLNTQCASATVIFVSSLLGGTVSTSQIVSSTVMGVGAGMRFKAVNWVIVKSIIASWVLTIPAVASVSASVYLLLHLLLKH